LARRAKRNRGKGVVVKPIFFLLASLCISLYILTLNGCAEQSKKPYELIHQYDEAEQEAKGYGGPIHPVAKKLYEQGLAAYRQQHWAEAADYFGQAADVGVTNFPQRPDAFVYQALALQKNNAQYEAYKVAKAAAQEYPARWELRLILADYYVGREMPEQAQNELSTALRLNPNQPDVLRAQAQLQLRRGNFLSAEELARRTVMLDRDNPRYRRLAADVYLESGMYLENGGDKTGALAAYYAAAGYSSYDPTPFLLTGRVLLGLGYPVAARRYIAWGRQFIKNPAELRREIFITQSLDVETNADEHRRMADFYLSRGQDEAGAQELELALAADPWSPPDWLRLGKLYAAQLASEPQARQCLFALWVLEPESKSTADLAATLKLPNEPDKEPSPGFVVRAEIGSGYEARSFRVLNAATVFPAGNRVFLSLVLGNAYGKKRIRLLVQDPNGKTAVDEETEMEFFGFDFGMVRTGTWNFPGQWTASWLMDDAPRATLTFTLQ